MSQATEAVKFPGAHAGPARWGALRRSDPQRCCQQRGPDPEISGRKGVTPQHQRGQCRASRREPVSQATEAVKFPGAHAWPARWGALRRSNSQRRGQQRRPDPKISGRKGVISSLILSFIHTEPRPHKGALFCYFKHDFDEILHLFDFYGMFFLALSMSGKRLAPLLSGRRFFAPISFWKGGLTKEATAPAPQLGGYFSSNTRGLTVLPAAPFSYSVSPLTRIMSTGFAKKPSPKTACLFSAMPL